MTWTTILVSIGLILIKHRDLNSWYNNDRPPIERLFSYPFYKNMLNTYLNQILNELNTSEWHLTAAKQDLISNVLQSDPLFDDYGFQYYDFQKPLMKIMVNMQIKGYGVSI